MKTYILKIFLIVISLYFNQNVNAQNSGIKFQEGTWKEVTELAKKENKLIFIDVYTSWCGPCKLMVRDIFPLPEVGNFFNKSFINYKIDAEKGEGISIAKEYGVNAYPTYIFVHPTGKLIYKSLGSMPADRFIKEGENALAEFNDPKPFAEWENEYLSRKNDLEFLNEYMLKRQKLQLDNSIIVEDYMRASNNQDLINHPHFQTLIQINPIQTDGLFFKYLIENKDAIIKKQNWIENRYYNQLARYLADDLDRAIKLNSEELMISISKKRELLKGNTNPLWEADALRMKFYGQTENEKSIIPVLKRYAKSVIAANRDSILNKGKSQVAQFDEQVKLGNIKISQDEMERTRNLMETMPSLEHAYRIRDIAKNAVQTSTNKSLLKDADSWLKVALSYSDHFTIYETIAALNQKLGKKELAITNQKKAIEQFNKLGLTNEVISNRLNENLSKINNDQAIWKLERNPKTVSVNRQ